MQMFQNPLMINEIGCISPNQILTKEIIRTHRIDMKNQEKSDINNSKKCKHTYSIWREKIDGRLWSAF